MDKQYSMLLFFVGVSVCVADIGYHTGFFPRYPIPAIPMPTPPSVDSLHQMNCYSSALNFSPDKCEAHIICPLSTRGLTYLVSTSKCKYNDDYPEYEGADLEPEDISDILLTINTTQNWMAPLSELDEVKHLIKTIIIENTDLENIPDEIYHCTKLKEIEIINNKKINVVSFGNFSKFDKLKKINLSSNAISSIVDTSLKSATSLVTSIDLSHNLIQTLPNESFVLFPELRHLNLSHNSLSNLNAFIFKSMLQLQTLQISNNKLMQIENVFTVLVNIQEIMLDHNSLSTIADISFSKLSKLEKLNISHNEVKNVDNNAFIDLVKLSVLDLSYNKIPVISRTLFQKNNALRLLSLRNNFIESIELGAFEGKNISEFYIENNYLSGKLEKGTLQGTHAKSLDLSGGKIYAIGPDAFSSLHLHHLNLSSNIISDVSKTSFLSLKLLRTLDLSNNYIKEIEISTLNDLSLLHIRNNSIEKISRNMFKTVKSLEELDLSHNAIDDIETKSFVDLGDLQTLILNNNPIRHSILVGAFDGLISLKYIDLTYTNIKVMHNGMFYGLTSLEYLNVSHSQLANVEYNTFKDIGPIEILDLSYNLLAKFAVGTSTISQVKYIYLNNNKITTITTDTFKGLFNLNVLDLSHNNIIQLEKGSFNTLVSLKYLDLQANTDMEISSGSFDNLSLEYLILSNNKKKMNFENATKVNVQVLDLSSCAIEDIDTVYVHKINNLTELILSSNSIKSIDKKSFGNISTLTVLDLSSNLISSIQPGTFLQTKNIETLNLHDNQLTKLQLGVFEGLKNLTLLNISSNMIKSFDSNNIRNLPSLKTIALDNNLIEHISFSTFAMKGIKKITIGGNPLPCHYFSELHRYTNIFDNAREFVVTADKLDYHSENIDGIKCIGTEEEGPWSVSRYNPTENVTLTLSSAINNLSRVIERVFNITGNSLINATNSNNTENNVTDGLRDDASAVDVKKGEYVEKTSELQNTSLSAVQFILCIMVICIVIILLICGLVFMYKYYRSGKIFVRQNGIRSTSTQQIANVIEMD